MSKSIGLIYKSSFYLSGNSLRILYNSLILPYLFYCNLVLGSTYKSNLQRLVILQKRALRIINKSKRDAHTDPILKKHKLLKCHDIHSFQLGVFMFLFINSALPTKFHKFLRNNQIHSYNTRNACSFHLPPYVEPISGNFLLSIKAQSSLIHLLRRLLFLLHFLHLRKSLRNSL